MNEEQKPQYDQMVAQIPVGVYRFRTSPDGKMTFEYVNRQFCQMLATTSEALYRDAQIAFDLVHPEDREDFVHQNEEVMKTHQPFSWEGRVIIDGEIKWFRISSIPEVLECGDIIWNGVHISANCFLKNCIIGANSSIETGNILDNCVIGDNITIEAQYGLEPNSRVWPEGFTDDQP